MREWNFDPFVPRAEVETLVSIRLPTESTEDAVVEIAERRNGLGFQAFRTPAFPVRFCLTAGGRFGSVSPVLVEHVAQAADPCPGGRLAGLLQFVPPLVQLPQSRVETVSEE